MTIQQLEKKKIQDLVDTFEATNGIMVEKIRIGHGDDDHNAIAKVITWSPGAAQ